MLYMLAVNMLVAGVVFGFAGLFILLLFVWTQAKEFAQSRRTTERGAAIATREHFAISRVSSRNHVLTPSRAE